MDRRAALASLFASLLGLGACERAVSSVPNPLRWAPPRVGDRVDWTFDLQTEILERNGVKHVMTAHDEFSDEVLAVAGEQVTRYRTKAIVDRKSKDGVVQPPDLATLEATMTASGIAVSKNGAPVPVSGQDNPMPGARSVLLGEAGRRSFDSRHFTVGERYRPTEGERLGLGFNTNAAELVVRAIDEDAIVFDLELASDVDDSHSLDAKGTLRLSNVGRDLDQAGELMDGGRHAGTMHVQIHSHFIRRDAAGGP